jgi:hypothetical protein
VQGFDKEALPNLVPHYFWRVFRVGEAKREELIKEPEELGSEELSDSFGESHAPIPK